MTTVFNKFLNVGARFQAGTVLVDNTDGQGLFMQWTFTRTTSPEPDQGELRIANLSATTRKLLQEQKTNLPRFRGSFYQGWQKQLSLIFNADIYDIIPDDRSQPETTWTIMKLGDGIEGYRDGTISGSFGDVDVDTLVTLIAGGMEIAVGKDAEGVLQTALPSSRLTRFKNGIVAMGSARDLMNELMGLLKLRWTVQNGELVLFPEGQPLAGVPAIVLSPLSGLLTATPARDGSIICEALSIPECTPGRQLLVQDDLGKPVAEASYRIEQVVFTGNTQTGGFMNVQAKKSVF